LGKQQNSADQKDTWTAKNKKKEQIANKMTKEELHFIDSIHNGERYMIEGWDILVRFCLAYTFLVICEKKIRNKLFLFSLLSEI
jgi:hypothetical protein